MPNDIGFKKIQNPSHSVKELRDAILVNIPGATKDIHIKYIDEDNEKILI